MATLQAVATTAPDHLASQEEITGLLNRLYRDRDQLAGHISSICRHANIAGRHLMRPLAWYGQSRSLAERNRIYLEEGVPLLTEACRQAMARAACPAEQIDQIITVSSTGLAAPSLDALLIEELGLPRHTRRIPTWGLGCLGGLAGLTLAADHLRAYPGHTVLVAALETCSLTFQIDDASRKNLVGTALFGDGAGAALIGPRASRSSALRIRDHMTFLFPDSADVMGWRIVDTGFELVLSAELPGIVRRNIAPLANDFLAKHDLKVADLEHFLLHPGGPKVLKAVLEGLKVTAGKGETAEQVLAEYGNLSSVSIFAVLERWQASTAAAKSGAGLMVAFGPGFSCTMLLFEV